MASLEDKLVESSKALISILVKQIGDNQELFDETMNLVYRDEGAISMRAAWLASHCLKDNIQLINPHIEHISKVLPHVKTDGIKRGFMWAMVRKEVDLTEEQLGIFTELAFQWAEDPKSAIAVKASSIDFLLRVYAIYPEIKPEFIALLESMIPEGSRGIKNKCTRLIHKLNKR